MATSLETESGEDVRTVIRGFYARSMFREAKFPSVNTVLGLGSFIRPQL
jgi:hypothetical protein